ncbi:F-box protein At2g17036 [Medicago truncatula]|uniref:F-box SKIP23-like protein n=2 Tax=Medicago truncatula TaxID=3880 RepID=G7IZH3_MEDTR|nr:F-box protein At2g17036 [Medicago truncatula]AES69417.1 F-box SKIP23-like protein [Medicago truncatula]
MASVDWSELPKDIIFLISQRLDVELDLIRFRSVCSTWRSSPIPNDHNILPFQFPLLKYVPTPDSISNNNEIIDNIENTSTSFGHLSKRSFFLVKPPQEQQQQETLIRRRPWLIRITQNSSGKTQLLKPPFLSLTSTAFSHLPNVVDFTKFSPQHLATDFIIDKDDLTFQNQHSSYLYPQKILAVTCPEKKPLVLGTLSYCSSKRVLFHDRDKRWTPVSNLSTAHGDICLFKGRFYVVDQSGQTVTVGPDSSTELAAQPLYRRCVRGENRKLLVENEGELLLLDIHQTFFQFSIKFFKLDEMEKKWVKLKKLGGRVLFVGSGCSFSASGWDLCLPKGNCVIFIDTSVLSSDNMAGGNRVFHLDRGQLSHVSEYPECENLFLPPEWILKI